MQYREIQLSDRGPKWSANIYFFIAHSGGLLYGYYHGYPGHMERHLINYPDHVITWLEPENEWDEEVSNKEIFCECESVETTDIRRDVSLSKPRYFHILCHKLLKQYNTGKGYGNLTPPGHI